MIHCSLQTKTNKKVLLWQGNRTCDAVVKFDSVENLQRYCAVLLAIARLSCMNIVFITILNLSTLSTLKKFTDVDDILLLFN